MVLRTVIGNRTVWKEGSHVDVEGIDDGRKGCKRRYDQNEWVTASGNVLGH